MSEQESQPVGVVLGTEPSTPLKWWIAIRPEAYVQLDDVVLVRTQVPGVGEVRLSGVVEMVRSQHEGSRFESDVFLSEAGVLPLQVASSARVVTTRVEPEIWVPPSPGEEVVRVRGEERDEALHFDSHGENAHRGAIPGSSARVPRPLVPGRTTRGTRQHFRRLRRGHEDDLRELSFSTPSFPRTCSGARPRTRRRWSSTSRGRTCSSWTNPIGSWTNPRASGTERWVSSPVHSARWGSGPRPDGRSGEPVPDTGSRQKGVRPYFWTVRDVVRGELLRFMFAEAGDERSQIADIVARVEAGLAREAEDVPDSPSTVRFHRRRWGVAPYQVVRGAL